MEPEIIIGALAVFVSGGAMGATSILLCQWVVGKMAPPQQRRLSSVDPRDFEVMKVDVADLAVRPHSVDARLDFTEDMLGGALSGARPPEPLPPPQAPPALKSAGIDTEVSSDAEPASSDAAPVSSDKEATSTDEEAPSSAGESAPSDAATS